MRRFFGTLFVVLTCGSVALADAVNPNSTVTISGVAPGSIAALSGTVIASSSTAFTFNVSPGVDLSGTLTTQIIQNSSGNYVFTYQVSNGANSAGPLVALLAYGFLGFSPDVNFFTGSGVPPATASLGGNLGDPLVFTFTSPLQPGEDSATMYILTSAVFFQVPGTLTLDYTPSTGVGVPLDAAGAPSAFDQNINPIPEPATFILLATGILPLLRRKR